MIPDGIAGKSQGPKLSEACQTANISNRSKCRDFLMEYADFDGLLCLQRGFRTLSTLPFGVESKF
jgi:hypothetical protein